MRAGVISGPGRTRTTAVRRPQPADGEVLIRVEGCGVCGSSLPFGVGRDWFAYPGEPGAPGHEAWGRTDDGRRVAALTYHGFAEWDVAAADHVVELPAALDDLPFPGEALACAANVVRRALVRPGDRVAVVGMGFLGTAIASLLDHPTEVRRETPVVGEFDVVIEAAGTQTALDTASRLVTAGGRLVLAGFHQDGPRIVDLQSWNWRGLDVVNAHERDPQAYVRGMRDAVELTLAGRLDVERLVTHRLPLDRLDEALELARTRPPGFVKAVVCP
jgi:threonine dehydrogenase-like Zn-dependent dehydrogenase